LTPWSEPIDTDTTNGTALDETNRRPSHPNSTHATNADKTPTITCNIPLANKLPN
jgi:hypothetical protein